MRYFFETRIENMKRFDSKNDANKGQKNKSSKKRRHSNQNDSKENTPQGTESGEKCCQYHGT